MFISLAGALDLDWCPDVFPFEYWSCYLEILVNESKILHFPPLEENKQLITSPNKVGFCSGSKFQTFCVWSVWRVSIEINQSEKTSCSWLFLWGLHFCWNEPFRKGFLKFGSLSLCWNFRFSPRKCKMYQASDYFIRLMFYF